MMFFMQIIVVIGVGLVIYAVFGVFASGKPQAHSKHKIQDSILPTQDLGKEQKIQRLQSQVAKLEDELEKTKVISLEEKSGLTHFQEKEAQFLEELKRREEWVAKAEAELAKIKTEKLDVNNKFVIKENELQDEFTKNVNLTREMREIKAALEAKEMAYRLMEDQQQAQKHQIESQLKVINEHLATITEFKRKEKISEWIPKSEFNQLNIEYTKLEKELEATQERLKSFAAEIAHLRQETHQQPPAPVEEVKPVEEVQPQEPQLIEENIEKLEDLNKPKEEGA